MAAAWSRRACDAEAEGCSTSEGCRRPGEDDANGEEDDGSLALVADDRDGCAHHDDSGDDPQRGTYATAADRENATSK